jgi:protein-S-isoprenylcysteine O-methyltransferase Ste14
MNRNEIVFRATVAALLIAGFAVRFYYQAQQRHVERVSARSLGRDKFFYWLVFTSYVLVLVYSFSTLLDAAHVDLPDALRWLGAPFGIAGVALLAATHRALGRNWSGVLEIAEKHALIVSGPYRRVRHPMYTAFFCIAIANALLCANLIVAIVGLAAVAMMYVARVTDEEAMLIEQFGDEYRRYMQRTGRLVPKPSRSREV